MCPTYTNIASFYRLGYVFIIGQVLDEQNVSRVDPKRPISNKKPPNSPETLTLPHLGSSHSDLSAPIDQDEMKGVGFSNLDDNLIFKVFKHVDARMLGMAPRVSRQWHKMMEDERLWKLICTRHWLRQPTTKICGRCSRRVSTASRPLHLASQQGLILL
ncbi:hypothetical protein EV1_014093 [Malus domestica]